MTWLHLVSQRTWLKWAGLAGVTATAALMGCGKRRKPLPKPLQRRLQPRWQPVRPRSSKSRLPMWARWATRAGPTRTTKAARPLKKEFGDKQLKTNFVEKVPEGPDAERVIRDLAGMGNQLIFGTTFGYMEPMLKVAADHPDIKFEHATGFKTAGNMRIYDSRL